MNVLINNQVVAMGYSFLLGVAMSAFFQLYSWLMQVFGIRKVREDTKDDESLKLRRLLIISDFLFFALITPICMVVAYGINNGIVRWYLLFCALLGAYVYKLTVGTLLGKLVRSVFICIRRLLKKTVFDSLVKMMDEK